MPRNVRDLEIRTTAPPAKPGMGQMYALAADCAPRWKNSEGNECPLATNSGCAHMYITATAPTTITVANAYYKMAGTTAAYICADFTHSNNRLTFALAVTKRFLVNIAFLISSNTKDMIVSFELHKNSMEVIALRIRRSLRVVGDIYVMAMASVIDLAPTEYVELWATSDTAGVILTLETLGFTMWG